jgi:colanic acid/amylovoran biosynthesis protein
MIKWIIVEPSSFACLNLGDVAMMQVAVARLRELWPCAEIAVPTSCPDLLSRYCPSATPISVEERSAWLSGRSLIGGLHQKLPVVISAPLRKMERQLWLRYPKVAEFGVELKAKLLHRTVPSPSGYRKRLEAADLLVLSGAGMLNDAFADVAGSLLDVLEFALQLGIPVVAFGRGIGPITNPELLAKARRVLPRFKLFALREGHTGLRLAESLGVPKERIRVTGDDAIEPAFQHRPSCLGDRIGINLRLAGYAGTSNEVADTLREPLLRAAQTLNSSLVPVPISFHAEDSDVDANCRLLGEKSLEPQYRIKTPEDAIRLIGTCRVMVTGSYHGGVFALAQGIPVVGLVKSPYYAQKFTGLMEQFPGGCRILDFRRLVTPAEIQNAICGAWESAEQVRPPLLEAAARQVELSRAAYQAARELLSS